MKVDKSKSSTSRPSAASRNRTTSQSDSRANSMASTGQRTGPKAGDLTPVSRGRNDNVSLSNEARNPEPQNSGSSLAQNLLGGWGMENEADSSSPRELAEAVGDDLYKLEESEQPNQALQGAIEQLFDYVAQDHTKEHGELPEGGVLLLDL